MRKIPRWLRITLRISGGLLLLVVLLWLGLAAYVNMNKESVLRSIKAQLNDNINGELSIGSMEPYLLKGFPAVSFELRDVRLQDSLYKQHGHRLIDARYLYANVDVFSLIKGQPHIKALTLQDATIYLFTDSTGYSNKSIFGNNKKKKEPREKEQPKIGEFNFRNVLFVFENDTKFKLFKIQLQSLSGELDYTVTGWDARVDVNALIQEFNFNINAGSFLKNKRLDAELAVSYDEASAVINVPLQDIKIDNDELDLGAKFYTNTNPTKFTVNVRTENILYKNALELVSPNISKNLKYLDLKKPLKLQADIYGLMKFRDTPLVNVRWEVRDNIFTIPGAEITGISFTGDYTNEVDPAKGHNDKNSRIHAYGMKGNYMDIPFTADTIAVTNLITPTLEGRFKSKFDIAKLGPVVGDRSFRFKDGQADLNLVYKGSVNPKDDTTPTYVNGYVQIKNAALSYLPRNLNFTNSSLTLLFREHDLYLNDMRLHTGTTTLNMKGTVLNFVNLYYSDPAKVLIDLDIKSPMINLNEFRSLLANRGAYSSPAANGAQVARAANRLDNLLEQSSMHMLINVNQVKYRKFNASNIRADVSLTENAIAVKDVHVNHADGSIQLNARLNQGATVNQLDLDARVDNVHINQFLEAFENFGQQTLTPENIQGRFFTQAKLSGKITDKGDIVSRSLNGQLSFNLKDGALVNFGPLMNVGKYIFRKRRLERVEFKDLKNTLEVKGDKIVIPEMMIESTALNARVEGVYALGAGTDIGVDIPLRNPKKDELILDDSLRSDQQMKGLVIHLRAVDDENGKTKIKLQDRKAAQQQESEQKSRRERRRNRGN